MNQLNFNQIETGVQNYSIARSNFIRLIFMNFFLASFIIPTGINAQGAKVNFTGTWIYNVSKSTNDGGDFQAARQLTIKHEGNNLTVNRVRSGQGGQMTTATEKYTLDGKESVNTSGRGPTRSVVTWGPDNKSLSFAIGLTIKRNGTPVIMRSNEEWILKDAKTLSIVSSALTQNGQRKATFIYDKK